MSREHNFSAGPAALPMSVLEELRGVLVEFGDTGAGLMEISHRSPAFQAVIDSAQARLRRLLGVPEDYAVLFLQGGASMQFFMSALNLAGPDEAVDFVVTGTWGQKAVKEAARVCDAQACFDGAEGGFAAVPTGALQVRPSAGWVHYTTNNTIYGTAFPGVPQTSARLVADMSSDICSGPIDVARHDVIYAGAQKNLGPSGVTAVLLSPWAVARSREVARLRPGGLPSMLNYALMVDKGSMYNTPNTFGIYALERVLAWVEGLGGLAAIDRRNQEKADLLYAELDRSAFWQPHASRECRSRMNITWRLADRALVGPFVKEAEANGLRALRGHRSVGGLRASIYNATGPDAVRALVSFMQDFERRQG